jgi:hypothetical protein
MWSIISVLFTDNPSLCRAVLRWFARYEGTLLPHRDDAAAAFSLMGHDPVAGLSSAMAAPPRAASAACASGQLALERRRAPGRSITDDPELVLMLSGISTRSFTFSSGISTVLIRLR